MKERPLRFHRFLTYFSLPFGILANAGALINAFKSYDSVYYDILLYSNIFSYNDRYELANKLRHLINIEIFALIVSILASIIAMHGLIKMQVHGPIGLFAFLVTTFTYDCYLAGYYYVHFPENAVQTLVQAIAALVYAIILIIYYFKRWRMFSTVSLNNYLFGGEVQSARYELQEDFDTQILPLLNKCRIEGEGAALQYFEYENQKYDINEFVTLNVQELSKESLDELTKVFDEKKKQFAKSRHKGLDNAILHSYRIAIEHLQKAPNEKN